MHRAGVVVVGVMSAVAGVVCGLGVTLVDGSLVTGGVFDEVLAMASDVSASGSVCGELSVRMNFRFLRYSPSAVLTRYDLGPTLATHDPLDHGNFGFCG